MIAHLLGMSLALLLLVTPQALGAAHKVSEREYFFTATNAHPFVIQIPPGEDVKLRKDNRAYVKCDVTVDGAFFAKDCGVHLKGGLRRPRSREGSR